LKTIIINNAGPRGPQGSVGAAGPSGSDANVPPLIISSSRQFTDITSPFTGSFTGSFAGDGSNLINVPASGVVGLNLSQISSGTATASISETGGLFVNTHITASGDISASSGTITALTGSFNHIITDNETLEFRSKTAGTKIGQLKFNSVNGLEIQDPLGARAKIRAARGEFLSLEAGPVGMNSIGSITASSDISASGRFIGDGSGLTNVFENTAVSSSLSSRITTSETNITNLQTDSSSFSTRITTNTSNASTNNAAFDNRITANETNISSGRALITGITSSLSTTGRMVFVGTNGTLTSEAGFEYNATTNQLSVDNLNVNHLTSSFITASRIFTSGSNIFGDASNDVQTLIGTTKISGSAQVTGSLNTSGIITGDGFGLTNIPASGIVGLNLSQIASGSSTASISPDKGLHVNTDIDISGSLTVSASSHRIEGSTVIYSTGTPGLTVQSNSDTSEEVKIYDAQIDVEDSGYMAARLSSNGYGNRIGILDLRHWAGNTGAVITASPTKISYIQSSLLIGKTGDPTAAGTYKLDVDGDIKLGNGATDSIEILGPVTASGNVSSSIASTASFGTYLGDGSNLSGISTTPFPFSGSAVITGSLIVSGSVVDFTSASAVNLNIESLPLVNPMVQYFTTTNITSSGTTVPIPGGLTFVSSSTYEYLEIFINGLRLRYNMDFIPASTGSVQYQLTIPIGSELTYKSLKRP
tara:strand:+ start:1205 stop:3319 length:2115 start_codon:yes stop_codon:yes gene_type:complete